MDAYLDAVKAITLFLRQNLESVSTEDVVIFISHLLAARSVFVIGAGRSGLVAEAFAMRLIHLNVPVYIVGKATTPAIKKGDLLVAITGSGKTKHVLDVVEKAVDMEIPCVSITSFIDSPVGKKSDFVMKIGGKEEKGARMDYLSNQLEGKYESLAPMGTLFELSSLVFLDCIIAELAHRLNMSEKDMKELHSNLE